KPPGKWSMGHSAKVGENNVSHLLAKPAQAHARGIIVSAGCCSLFRSEALTEYKELAAEDMELSMRLSREFTLAYEPTAICYSSEPPNMRVYIKQRIRWITGFLQCFKLHIYEGDMLRKNFKVWLMSMYMFMSGFMGLPLLTYL